MIISFDINEQIIRKTSEQCLANHTNNYLHLHFSFNETWDEYDDKYILYHYQDKVYQQILEYDDQEEVFTTIVPRDALLGKGFKISLYGTKEVEDAPNDRITTSKYKINLAESGFTVKVDPINYDYNDDVFTYYENLFTGLLSQKADLEHSHDSADIQDLEVTIGSDVKRGLNTLADNIRMQ